MFFITVDGKVGCSFAEEIKNERKKFNENAGTDRRQQYRKQLLHVSQYTSRSACLLKFHHFS